MLECALVIPIMDIMTSDKDKEQYEENSETERTENIFEEIV